MKFYRITVDGDTDGAHTRWSANMNEVKKLVRALYKPFWPETLIDECVLDLSKKGVKHFLSTGTPRVSVVVSRWEVSVRGAIREYKE